MRYSILTFGCQMNQRDSETLAGLLASMGYTRAEKLTDADLVIVNTCCVRESAENRIYGHLGELKNLKTRKPHMVIGVCGCMAQQPGAAEKIRQRAPHVDLIFGTHNLHRLPELLRKLWEKREPVVEIWESDGDVIENLPALREDSLKAWVTIMYGCNNFCTYCIVPYVRGRERSRRPEDIEREVRELVEKGVKEVTLLGQNVNSYGKDLDPPTDFASLLERLDRVEGLLRIRYTTSHPRDFTDRLIDVIAASKKVCENFHLPVQAGSNRILQRMNRGYTREYYMELVEKIRAKVPGAAITTDIIVGFPGETEEDFADTMDLVEKVRFDSAFTFVYNKRSGTPAAEMPDQVPAEVKRRRITHLVEVQNRITLEKNLAEVGTVQEVLVEGPAEKHPDKYCGRTGGNKLVFFPPLPDKVGQIVPVRITAAKMWNLEGEPLLAGEGEK